MLNFILITLIALQMFFGLLFFVNSKKLKYERVKSKELANKLYELTIKAKNTKSIATNKRGAFRVEIYDGKCNITILETNNPKLKSLVNKEMKASLKNISANGALVSGVFDLPLSSEILVKVDYELKDKLFSLIGVLIRKDEHLEKNEILYGVKISPSEEEERELIKIMNTIELERKKE